MKHFMSGRWLAWEGIGRKILLSDELNKKLYEFNDPDGTINWLYMQGFKDDARALHAHQASVSKEPAIRVIEQGAANEYALLTSNNSWVAAVRINGEWTVEKQRQFMKAFAEALAKEWKP